MTSLGSRLTLWYVLIITSTVAAALLTGRILLQRELIHGIDLLNAAESEEIRDRVNKNGGVASEPEVLREITAHSKIDAPLYFFELHDAHNQVIFRSDNMEETVFPKNPPGQANWTTTTDKLGDVRLRRSRLDRTSFR